MLDYGVLNLLNVSTVEQFGLKFFPQIHRGYVVQLAQTLLVSEFLNHTGVKLVPVETENEKAEQEKIEQQLAEQTAQRIGEIKQTLGQQLDKFGQEVMAFLKSTGQTKPKSQEKPQEKSQSQGRS